jgi:hypothetical protein
MALVEELVTDCLRKVDITGSPPSIFSEFLGKFVESEHYRLLHIPNTTFDLYISIRVNSVSYRFFYGLNSVCISLLAMDENDTVNLYRNDLVQIIVHDAIFNEILAHLGCYVSSLLLKLDVKLLDITSESIDETKICLNTLLLTPTVTTFRVDTVKNLELILNNLDVKYFTTVDTVDKCLELLIINMEKFESLLNIKFRIMIYSGIYSKYIDLIRRLLETKIHYFSIGIENKHSRNFKRDVLDEIFKTHPVTDLVIIPFQSGTYDLYSFTYLPLEVSKAY